MDSYVSKKIFTIILLYLVKCIIFTVFGINDGSKLAHAIYKNKSTRAYHITGKFGEATDNYFMNGKVVERATYHRIRRSNIDSLLASMQASHQRKMFEYE